MLWKWQWAKGLCGSSNEGAFSLKGGGLLQEAAKVGLGKGGSWDWKMLELVSRENQGLVWKHEVYWRVDMCVYGLFGWGMGTLCWTLIDRIACGV